eukprot:11738485-Alexandrium_andersonii.AAC.1
MTAPLERTRWAASRPAIDAGPSLSSPPACVATTRSARFGHAPPLRPRLWRRRGGPPPRASATCSAWFGGRPADPPRSRSSPGSAPRAASL